MPEDETDRDEAAAYVCHIVTWNSITSADESQHPTEADRTPQELQATTRVDPAYIRLPMCTMCNFKPIRPTKLCPPVLEVMGQPEQ